MAKWKEKKRGGKHNIKLSDEKVHRIFLHIASVSLQFIDVPPNSDRKMGGKKQAQLHKSDDGDGSSATIQYCTQVIIQIYTDTSVMYKNKDEQSKAIC